MSNKKKIIVICVMVVLLVAAAYLNVLLNKKNTQDVNGNLIDDSAPVGFFNGYRETREATRNEDFGYLSAIISSESSSVEAKAAAEAKQLQIIETAETEMVIEALIKAKGFEDAIVTINTNNVNVVVNSEALTSEDVQQILNIITTETGVTASNVIINPYG